MATKTHKLKCSPIFFHAVENRRKNFEVRKNDRKFKIGEIVILQEYSEGEYTGESCRRVIHYILDDPEYCKEGYVILGF